MAQVFRADIRPRWTTVNSREVNSPVTSAAPRPARAATLSSRSLITSVKSRKGRANDTSAASQRLTVRTFAASITPSRDAPSGREPNYIAEPQAVPMRWRRAVTFIAVAMLTCNLDRTALAVAGLPIRVEFGFSQASMGVLQSSYLWGYALGQIPAGILSDKYGGPKMMMAGLVIWSLATIALPFAHFFENPLAVMAASRCVFGLASAVALPAVTAGVSALVPKKRRGRMLSYIYASFNVGSILGVAVTPALTAEYGWKAAFVIFGVFGVIVSILAFFIVPNSTVEPLRVEPGGHGADKKDLLVSKERAGRDAASGPAASLFQSFRVDQVLYLVWVHGVIGWGYFILLSWIPTYLTEFTANSSLGAVGLLSAIPWVVSAAVGIWGGSVSDFLAQTLKWESFRIRTVMHSMATIGPACALLLLPLVSSKVLAVSLLCFALGMQSFNYTGFHAHIQDVASPYAGTILSITNSMGILMGIVGNILTGVVLEQTGTFSPIFQLTGALYISSFLLWAFRMRALPLVKKLPTEDVEMKDV